MKKLLVTGASGFVGSHIVEQGMASESIEITALVRNGSDISFLESIDANIESCDLDDLMGLRDIIKDIDCVIHCAAKVGDWGDYDEYKKVNIDLTRNLLEMCAASKSVKQFIYISSLGVYSSKDHFETDESTPPDTKGIDPYTKTKALAEKMVSEYEGLNGLGITILRPGFIYGRRDNTVLPSLVSKLKDGKIVLFGDGSKKMNNTWVLNLVKAVFLAVEKDNCRGIFNIHDGKLASKKEFINLVAKYSDNPAVKKNIPLPVARFLAYCFDFLYRLFGAKSSPLISLAKFKFMGLNLSFSIEKARNELGYSPDTDFSENLKTSLRQ